jgi:hypothetical protein
MDNLKKDCIQLLKFIKQNENKGLDEKAIILTKIDLFYDKWKNTILEIKYNDELNDIYYDYIYYIKQKESYLCDYTNDELMKRWDIYYHKN